MKKVAFFLFCFNFFISANLKSQSKNIDSLLKVLETSPDDTVKVKKTNKYSWISKTSGDFQKAESLALQAIRLSEKLNYKSGLAWGYHILSVVKQEQGNYPASLSLCLIALKLREELKDENVIAGSLIALGNIYSLQKNYSQALVYFEQALEIEKKTGDKNGEAMICSNIGITYRYMRKFDIALQYQRQAYKIRQETNDTVGCANSEMAIANIYMDIGKYDEALKLQESALRKFIKEDVGSSAAICYGNIGNLYLLEKKYNKAIDYFQRSISLEKNYGLKEGLLTNYMGLATADSALGDVKGELKSYKLFILYRDSLINEESTKKLIQLQMQYDFDKKSDLDSIKNLEARRLEELKYQQEISQQKTFAYGGIFGFLVMVIVAGISFRAFRNKKKANIEIQHQKRIVEEKQKEILDSIHYAKRIQTALLASDNYIQEAIGRLNKKT